MGVVANLLTRLPLTFEGADGGTTHAPMIIASAGGAAPARLILDTGSEVHLLNEDLVDELGLVKEPGEEGTDHSGTTMPSWNVGSVAMELGGVPLSLRDVVSIPALPKFLERGIRGIVSPQNLHPTAWTVIDLAADELLMLEAADQEQLADYLTARSPTLQLLKLLRETGFPSVVVAAALDGFDEMPTMLNTGGKGTEYSRAAVPGLIADSEVRLGGGVFGVDYSGGSIGRRTIVVGGRRIGVENVLVRETMHDPQAIVGMDVLRATVLVCAADLRRPVLWMIPSR